MAEWLEHTVQVEVGHSVEKVWQLWSSLELMPNWMKWIVSVKIPVQNPEISNWELGTSGLTFTWRSRILKQIPNQIIQWESIDGLANRGAIRFYRRPTGTIIKLTVAYALPSLVKQVLDGLAIPKIVESTLQADLERFNVYINNYEQLDS